MLPAGAGVVSSRWSQPTRRPSFIVERPMPATQEQVEELRAYLRWAQQRQGWADAAARERVLIEALQKALQYLDDPDARENRVRYILHALNESVIKKSGMYFVRDRDLNTWSHDQIAELFGDSTEGRK